MDRVDYVYSGFLSDKVKSFHNENVIWMSDMDIIRLTSKSSFIGTHFSFSEEC